MSEYSRFVGMDVHKSTVAVAIAEAGRKNPVSYGIIENSLQAIARMAKKLSKSKTKLTFCYEAGPSGYGVYRQIVSLGHHCDVVAPSLIPRKAGDRVKTD
jgi:transposase